MPLIIQKLLLRWLCSLEQHYMMQVSIWLIVLTPGDCMENTEPYGKHTTIPIVTK